MIAEHKTSLLGSSEQNLLTGLSELFKDFYIVMLLYRFVNSVNFTDHLSAFLCS